MSDVFISYAHSTARQARGAADALRALGYSVWLDDDLLAHRAFSAEIEAQLTAAKAALVIWSADAAKSDWVLSEANRAREERKLVQLRVDQARLPMPFDQIHCADLSGWSGEGEHAGWTKIAASIEHLVIGGDVPSPAPASKATLPPTALPLPEKPSIAVLPFADPSGRVEGDYFADGMVDEIVNALTCFPSLFVVASGSSLSYRERERDFPRIGRELGVRYLLEGSVRRSGPRVRIAADLVEAEAGAVIWSERFEGTLEDVFALQDEVANAAAARIEPAIQAADLRRGAARPTEDLGAYDLFLRALARHREFDKAGELAAIGLAEQAVGRDPGYAVAWGLLAALQATTLFYGWAADPEETARKCKAAIRHALLADADDAPALAMVASAMSIIGEDRRAALPMADRALTLNPGSFLCWSFAGQASVNCGQMEQALERFQQALRLNPRGPARCAQLVGIGAALNALQRPEEALTWLNEAVALRPEFPFAHLALALALSNLGRIEEGRAALARFETRASLRNFRNLLDNAGTSEVVLPLLRRLGANV